LSYKQGYNHARGFTDALGPFTPNKLRQVDTGILLVTTISVQKQGLNIAHIDAIL
jgi:hypothetical protein